MTSQDELAEARLDRLIDRLPGWLARGIHRVRQPDARWVRIPVAVICLLGGLLFFLPFLGAWMFPLGIFLLVEDLPFLRRGVYAAVNWLAEKRPRWFA